MNKVNQLIYNLFALLYNMKIPCKNKIFLAPMEEVNDIAFRLLCKKAGAGLTFTGMIHPQTQQNIDLDDFPVLQLFCTTTKGIKEFIKKYDKKVSGWDFNLGCPAKTARKHGFGFFLSNDLETIEKILKTIRANTKKFFTIKIRKSKNAFKILKLAERYCDAIIVHPRTQSQGYGGDPDLNFALNIKKKSHIPVIYSGNVDKESAKDYLKKFDYVMIGRKAMGNPSLFGGTKIKFQEYLNLARKYKLPFRQIKFQAMCFTKGQEDSRELREKISKIKNLKELKLLNQKLF